MDTRKTIVTKLGNTITYCESEEKNMARDYETFLISTARGGGRTAYEQAFLDYANLHVGKHGTIYITLPNIKNVIFNPPATVVYFKDGTKTVVKCQEGDEFDAEKGLAMAVAKRAYGNKGNYCDQMKKWVEEWNEEQARIDAREKENHALDAAMKRFVEAVQKPWRIWWIRFDQSLAPVERCVRGKYLNEEFASERYTKFAKDHPDCSVIMCDIDPWADNTIIAKLPLRDFDEDMEFVAAKSNELKLKADDPKPWHIWYRQIDPKTLKSIGSGVDIQTYNTFDEAVKAAHAKYMYNDEYHFWISRNNPWTGEDK